MKNGFIIAQLRESRGWSQKDLADRLGISQGYVGHWESNKRRISNEYIIKLANIFDVSTDYILGLSDKKEFELLNNTIYTSEKTKYYVPVLNVAAGSFASDDTQDIDEIELPEKFDYLKDKAFAVRVCGESMNKILPNGHIVLCEEIAKTGYQPKNGDLVVFEHQGEYTVKQLVETNTMIILDPCSTDEQFQPIIFQKKEDCELNILGVVKRGYIDFD